MAASLNKNRIALSRGLAALALALFLVSTPLIPDEHALHEALEFIGYALVAICAFGRVYCVAYIGGRKNDELVTRGPFSIVRNPLYVCSFIGVVGIGLITARITLIILLPLLFAMIYRQLVLREENFLKDHFGDRFTTYSARVPRFVPNFGLWQDAGQLTLNTKPLFRAIGDAFCWFLAFPAFEAIDWLHMQGYLPSLFVMP